MTAPGEWIHIADHAWELHGTGAQYTVHQEGDQWVARRFSLSHGGDATREAEQPAPSLEEAKGIVQRWDSQKTARFDARTID